MKILEGVKQNKHKKLIVYLSVCFMVILLLELTIFNYKYWLSLGNQPVKITPYACSEEISYISDDTWYFNQDYTTLYFRNINQKVNNIQIEFEDKTNFAGGGTWRDYQTSNYLLLNQLTVKIMIDDYSNSAGLEMPERTIVDSVKSTHYINLHLSGTSNRMSMQFIDVSGRTIQLKDIIINANIPMNFSIKRIVFLFALAVLIYLLKPNSELYSIPLNIDSLNQRTIIAITAIVIVAFGFYLIQSNRLLFENNIWFSPEYANRYNMLTDALLDGHFYIDKEVAPEILTLENPYDPAALESVGQSWNDFAYFNGKYYVYFGIVPVLLFYLPAKVLFGLELSPSACTTFLIPLFVVGSFLMIYQLARLFKKTSKDIPLITYLLFCILFINGTFGLFGLSSPDMYYLPIFTSITLFIWGLFFWLFSIKNGQGNSIQIFETYELKPIPLATGSLCMALLAGSRPQFLALVFIAIPIFWDSALKKRILFSKKSIVNTLCFVLPFVVFASFMFWYNYSRFGNIFDFGAAYNLTSNDMTTRGFSIARALQGIYYYLLQPTTWEESFPFIHIAVHNTQYTGTNIFEDTYGGILFLQPSIFLLFFIPKIKKSLKNLGIYWLLLILIISGCIIAAADSIMAAVLSRYYLDFGVAFILAVIIFFMALNNENDDLPLKKNSYKVLPYLTFLSVAITIMMVFDVIHDGAGWWYSNPERFNNLKTLIEFWY